MPIVVDPAGRRQSGKPESLHPHVKECGYRVTVARSGCQALKRFFSGRFNAVLMDIEMPVMNGYQTAAAIRRKELPSDVRTPIIALTAHLPENKCQKWSEAGMDAYLTKPIDVDKLVSLVESLTQGEFRKGGNVNVHTAANPGTADENRLEPVMDFAATMRRLDNDRELFQNFVEIFNEDAPKLLESILSAAAGEDLITIRRNVHALRGLAANFNAKALEEIASRLELADADELLQGRDALPEKLAKEIARVREALSLYR